MTPKPNQKVPQFPKRVANSAVRRTPQASALVLSPPRPGHSSCMRNIFSVSSIGRALPQEDEGFISYPVLPSLSRTPSSAKQESQARQPGNIVVPPLPTPAADSAAPESKHQLTPTRSSSSSESWSGDSGYFISGAAAHIRHPVRPYTPNSQTQIDEWLSRVSPDYGICQVDGAADADAQECTTTEYTSEDDASILAGRRIARTAKREEATLTQQPSSNTNQKSKAITQAPFLPSNPLSPSVCLNRGSSLSQSSGNVRDPDTPTKKTRPGPSVQSRGSVISEAQVKSSNRLEEKENSAVTYKAPTTYEWQVSGPTAARAQFWRSPLSRRGGLARASMRGAGSSRGPH